MLADFSGKKKAYLKYKIVKLETNIKIKNIRDLYRGINDFKKGYQHRINRVKDEKRDLLQTPIDHWGDPGVDGRVILRWFFRK
jgi:hypothetical protein